jgi:hypothetical protein
MENFGCIGAATVSGLSFGGPYGGLAGLAIGVVGCIRAHFAAKHFCEVTGKLFDDQYLEELTSGRLYVKSDVWIKRTQSLTYEAAPGHTIYADPTLQESG